MQGYLSRYQAGGRINAHEHDWDQMVVVTHAAVTIETPGAFFVQPPGRAFWLPAGVRHAIHGSRAFSLYCLYAEPGAVDMGDTPRVVALSELARELVFLICGAPGEFSRTPKHHHANALLTLLLAEAREEPFSLPRPLDPRAAQLARYFIDHPEDGRPLEAVVAEEAGASLRTLERLFLAETGLTVAAWRRQSRLLMALYMLDAGGVIARVAASVGYDSTTAFSTAFKASFGATPSAYLGAKRTDG